MLPITSLITALTVLAFIAFSMKVAGMRRHRRVGVGHGNDVRLELAIGAHSNFVQYTLFFLLLLLLLELAGAMKLLLLALAIFFFVGRAFHAYSLLKAERYDNGKLVSTIKYRVIGMMLTFLPLFAGALLLCISAVDMLLSQM